MIRLEQLAFAYADGPFRLEVPELRVAPGERVAVVGPSGSGKTTLLRLIAGIVTPDAGWAVVRDVEVSALPDAARRRFRRRHVGLVFQEFELLEYLSVLDNVLLPYRIHPVLRLDREVRERAESIAERVGIVDYLHHRPAALSHGERQRVAVCRALVTRPPLLLADEPTGNLDPTNKDRVLENLLECAAAEGATVLTVTHDHDLLPRFGRVVDCLRFHDSGVA